MLIGLVTQRDKMSLKFDKLVLKRVFKKIQRENLGKGIFFPLLPQNGPTIKLHCFHTS